MGKNVVIITAKGKDTFTEDQRRRLEDISNVTYHTSLDPIPADTLADLLRDADVAGLTPRSVPVIDESWIHRLPNLKGIAVFATGVDYIDTELLDRRNILLSHLPDYSAISVSEHALGMLLTLSRRIHLSQDRVRGRVPQNTSVRGWELSGKTMGIVGLGRIGSRVASIAQSFGMRVLGHDLKEISLPGVINVKLEELLVSSDIVSLHIPSQWNAAPIFGSAEINQMKKGSVMINVSRESLVDNHIIVQAIQTGQLKGYAVDEYFPLREEKEAKQLIKEGRILQTGHTAWYSDEVIDRGYEAWVENICGLVAGNPSNLIVEKG